MNVSSVYGVMGRPGMGQYDTTKAAVLGLTRARAVEEAPHGIRVNAVCPGSTANENLLGRWVEPREIARPILFLACEESSYITGATLMVDAGKSIV